MTHFVRSDSILAGTAAELRARHYSQPGGDGTCPTCGWPAPCPTARHADSVLAATPGLVAERLAAPPLRVAA